jgi:hypothetical protein
MTTNDQLKAARLEVLRSSASIANLIDELAAELARMKERRLPAELIDKKDAQIESLINYYNSVDQLIRFYQLTTLNQQIQLMELCETLTKSNNHNQEILHILRPKTKPTCEK